TWMDARWFGAAAGAGFYFYKRGQGQAVLGTIIVGMAVYLPLHIGLGW
ncbi:MAG: AzlD domain-containing protein, partial [Betaproteobacteria bacterium]|nr:AzlD domain-containing protein [Betaproteobacteria bacterium]